LLSLPQSIIVELGWSVMDISLGAMIGIVSRFTTSEARVTTSGKRGIVPHRCSRRGVLAILWKTRTLH
jgi:hypothetical protein